jgi:hypothetical protein
VKKQEGDENVKLTRRKTNGAEENQKNQEKEKEEIYEGKMYEDKKRKEEGDE